MLSRQSNASVSFLQKYINIVEQRFKFSHFEGSIIPEGALGKINIFVNCSSGISVWRFLKYFLKVLGLSGSFSIKIFLIKNASLKNEWWHNFSILLTPSKICFWFLKYTTVTWKSWRINFVKDHSWCEFQLYELFLKFNIGVLTIPLFHSIKVTWGKLISQCTRSLPPENIRKP